LTFIFIIFKSETISLLREQKPISRYLTVLPSYLDKTLTFSQMKKIITTALASLVAIYGYSQDYLPLGGGNLSGQVRVDLNTTGSSFIGTGGNSNFHINHDGSATVNLINSGGGGFSLNGSLRGTSANFSGVTISNGFALSSNNTDRFALWLASPSDMNHALYNGYSNIDGEGSWDGLKMNVYDGLNVRVGGNRTSGLFVHSSGKVGLGTASPSGRFSVGDYFVEQGNSNRLVKDLLVSQNTHNNQILASHTVEHNLWASYSTAYHINTLNPDGVLTNRFSIAPNGNVGIGTTSPFSRLHIRDGIHSGTLALGSEAYPGLISSSAVTGELRIDNRSSFIGYISFFPNGQSTTVGSEAMRIDKDGNVCIGTTTPDSKLTVSGKIHSREVKVTVDAGADFVFEKNYALKPLAEVEQYITENKHLPEIASAAEMKKSGLELGEMNIKLLQKVEELTLYLIKQDKRIQELEKQLK
jgi:hypothetical protein